MSSLLCPRLPTQSEPCSLSSEQLSCVDRIDVLGLSNCTIDFSLIDVGFVLACPCNGLASIGM